MLISQRIKSIEKLLEKLSVLTLYTWHLRLAYTSLLYRIGMDFMPITKWK